MNTAAEIYVGKYDDLLKALAAVVVDAAVVGDEKAVLFLAESIRVILKKASMILDESRAKGGHC